jgi:hypothetical protein
MKALQAKALENHNIGFSNVEKWTILILILLSFTGISVITIGKALLTPFHLCMGFLIGYGVLVSKKSEKRISLSLLSFMAYVLFVNILQYPSIRYTSILYTMIYGIEITILYHLLKKCSKGAILFAFKCIIYLYFANLFVGFILDTLHIRISLIETLVKVYYTEEGAGRPMGFSSEPSYAAFMLSVVFLCHSHLRAHKIDKESIQLAVMIVLSVLLSKSAYGFIFIAVLILDQVIVFYKKGNTLIKNLLPVLTIVGIISFSFMASFSNNETLVRITDFASVLVDPSYEGKARMLKLQEADGSAFARVGPTYLLFSENDPSDFIVGKGAGAAGVFLAEFLQGILVDEGRESVDTGIIPALVYDYGIIGGFLFFTFIAISFNELSVPFWMMFILILPNANINTQLIWFCIACFLFVNLQLRITHNNTKKKLTIS